jgi:hypothetical protein
MGEEQIERQAKHGRLDLRFELFMGCRLKSGRYQFGASAHDRNSAASTIRNVTTACCSDSRPSNCRPKAARSDGRSSVTKVTAATPWLLAVP